MNKNKISNVIYNAIIGICEGREANGSYKGNGHHLAQEITEATVAALLNNVFPLLQDYKIYEKAKMVD